MSEQFSGKGYNGNNPRILKKIKESLEGMVVKSSSGEYIIEEYVNHKEVRVRFIETGFTTSVDAKEARKGSVKDPLFKSVCGVGYFGIGEYKAKESESNTPAYEVWRGIIRRCYDENYSKNKLNGRYEDVVVSEKWHNFQNFAEWFYSQKYWESSFDVDKDLKVIGNKVYGEEGCSLVPTAVNSLFSGSNERLVNRELPKGVHFCKSKLRYIAQIHIGELTKSGNKKQTYIGQYEEKYSAIMAYKVAKENHVKEVAEKYRDVIDKVVYENLRAYVYDVSNYIAKE